MWSVPSGATKKYMNMKHLEVTAEEASITGWLHSCQGLQTKVRKILDTTEPAPSEEPVAPVSSMQPEEDYEYNELNQLVKKTTSQNKKAE